MKGHTPKKYRDRGIRAVYTVTGSPNGWRCLHCGGQERGRNNLNADLGYSLLERNHRPGCPEFRKDETHPAEQLQNTVTSLRESKSKLDEWATRTANWEVGPDPFVDGGQAARRDTTFGMLIVRMAENPLSSMLRAEGMGGLAGFEVWHFPYRDNRGKCVWIGNGLDGLDEDVDGFEAGRFYLDGEWDENFIQVAQQLQKQSRS